MRVKVCGITREEDVLLCSRLEVQALGFNFYEPGSRYVDPDRARELAALAPPFTYRVGVFVNEDNVAKIRKIAEHVKLDALQFHGDESPDYCRRFAPWSVIKAFRMSAQFSPKALRAYDVSAFLLDGFKPGCFGGTGVTADWQAAAATAKEYRVILSGGLTDANVVEAVRCVNPVAVDVCSGVELCPGMKDGDKLRSFLQALQAGVGDE